MDLKLASTLVDIVDGHQQKLRRARKATPLEDPDKYFAELGLPQDKIDAAKEFAEQMHQFHDDANKLCDGLEEITNEIMSNMFGALLCATNGEKNSLEAKAAFISTCLYTISHEAFVDVSGSMNEFNSFYDRLAIARALMDRIKNSDDPTSELEALSLKIEQTPNKDPSWDAHDTIDAMLVTFGTLVELGLVNK